MVVVLVKDRELAQILAVKFAHTVGIDPGESLQRGRSVGLLAGGSRHTSLHEKGDSSLGKVDT
jgi:hypothetical protein